MYKVAILGCENSHADAFLKAVIEDKIVNDIEFVGVYSDDMEAAQKLHDRFGVYAAQNYDEFVGKLDGVIVTARHGANHYKYAKPYIPSGIPIFIDKPITHSEEDARDFMAELKEHNVPAIGGTMVKFAEGIERLKESIKKAEYGNILGGFIRMPLNKSNPYGNFHFYSQHGIQCMMEVFGMNPRSVQVFDKGTTYTCVVRYDEYDVVLFYTEDSSVYYQAIDYEKKFLGEELSLKGCAEKEFLEFHELLVTRKQKISYEELFAPVYVINAIDRAIKSGKEEPIVKYEV